MLKRALRLGAYAHRGALFIPYVKRAWAPLIENEFNYRLIKELACVVRIGGWDGKI